MFAILQKMFDADFWIPGDIVVSIIQDTKNISEIPVQHGDHSAFFPLKSPIYFQSGDIDYQGLMTNSRRIEPT